MLTLSRSANTMKLPCMQLRLQGDSPTGSLVSMMLRV